MDKMYIIIRLDINFYYQSILPNGSIAWCENSQNSIWLTESEARLVIAIIKLSNPDLSDAFLKLEVS